MNVLTRQCLIGYCLVASLVRSFLDPFIWIILIKKNYTSVKKVFKFKMHVIYAYNIYAIIYMPYIICLIVYGA